MLSLTEMDVTSPTAPAPAPRRPRRTWFALVTAAAAVALFFGLSAVLRHQQRQIVTGVTITDSLDERGNVRPLSEVVEAARALKLVTVVMETRVQARMTDDRWYGDVSAVVEAPVRYVYAVDLAKLERSAIGYVTDTYVVTVPPPAVIAVEVDGSNPIHEVVETSGMRYRSMAGEKYLGLARKAIYDNARREVLPAERAKQVREQSREQVAALIRHIIGADTAVRVRFEDE
jgi:hypothetical protein